MTEPNTCPQCGGPLPPVTPQGLCPACLLKRGLETNTIGFTAEEHPGSKWRPPDVETLGASFPELDIIELIGRGGMGAVYKAREKTLDRLVALKILPPEIARETDLSKNFAHRFAREAQAMAKLNHPNIVTIYSFGSRPANPSPLKGEGKGEGETLFYFIMEYVDGLSLRQLLNVGQVSPKEALAIVPQICDALQYAHDRGIVHRDIKPENILLNRQGQVKIADFGLAKLVGLGGTGLQPVQKEGGGQGEPGGKGTLAPGGRGQGEGDVTLPGEKVMGTPQYMAPEQMARPQEVDNRADIYSLGVVFYQMLTGELPKNHGLFGERLEPPSRKVVIDVRLDEVVLRALEKEPSRRYQQVSEVKTQVETIVGTSPTMPPGEGDEHRLANARQAVRIPAIGMMVTSGLCCVLFLVVAVVALAAMAHTDDRTVYTRALEYQIFMLVGLSLSGLTLLGAIRMLQLRNRGLAITAAILSLFAGPPGLAMGIWALVVLNRREVDEAFDAVAAELDEEEDEAEAVTPAPAPPPIPDAQRIESARQAVKAPAIGLIVAAAVNLVAITMWAMCAYFVEMNWFFTHPVLSSRAAILTVLAALCLDGVVVWGAVDMLRHLKHLLLATICALATCAAAPATLCTVVFGLGYGVNWNLAESQVLLISPIIVCLPIGIWALVVLSRREVIEAFQSGRTRASAPAAKPGLKGSVRSMLLTLAWHGVLLIAFLALVLVAVPKCEIIFKDFHATAPPMALASMDLARGIRLTWIVLVPAILGLDAAACFLLQSLAGSRARRWWSWGFTAAVVVVAVSTVAAVCVPLHSLMRSTHTDTFQVINMPLATVRPGNSASKVTLPSGVTVELVGVSENPSTGKPWWRPDGTPLAEAPYARMEARAFAGEKQLAREFAVRLGNLPSEAVGFSFGGAGGYAEDAQGHNMPDVRGWAVAVSADAPTMNVKVGVAAGPWTTHFTGPVKGFVESSVEGASIAWAEPYEQGGKTNVTVSHNLPGEVRVVAVDKTGNQHTTSRQTTGNAGNVTQLTATFDIPLAEVKEFQLQSRPYEWTEFKNVALRPLAEATTKPNMGRSTPLHEAAAGGHGETCEMLIAHGFDPNARDESGRTPLHLAAIGGHRDTATRLLNKGADINAMDNQGRTALDEAAAHGHEDLVEFLLSRQNAIRSSATSAPAVREASPQATQPAHTIAFYVVTSPDSVRLATKTPIEKLVLAAKPFLTQDDIRQYDWQTHTIHLRPGAIEQVPEPKGPSHLTVPFVVVVDGRRLYLGMLQHPLSQQAYMGVPRITVPQLPTFQPPDTFQIMLGEGTLDPRPNETLHLALQAMGLLKTDTASAAGPTTHPTTQPATQPAPAASAPAGATRMSFDALFDAQETAMRGRNLSPEAAEALEQKLTADPNELISRTALLGYYFGREFQSAEAAKDHDRHVLWVIEHAPESATAGLVEAQLDRGLSAAYPEAGKLWMAQVEAHQDNVSILGNAANFFLLPDKALAEKYLKMAKALQPANPQWAERLGHLYQLEYDFDPPAEAKAYAEKALAEFEEAAKLVHDDAARSSLLQELAESALVAGDLPKAEGYASDLLKQADRRWSYGNDIHYGNIVLGRIALRRGDVEKADAYLLAAGRTPGSPNLDSFGPDMHLAAELLEKKQDKVVLEYLSLCEKFWKMDRGRLKRWEAEIRGGGTPNLLEP